MKNENFLLNFEADLGNHVYYTDYLMRLERKRIFNFSVE